MKKILIVDDSDYIQESLLVILSLEGYEVHTASNGEEGYKRALEIKPDLILCDIQMPVMDGYEMLELVRKTPEIESTPFIFLTAFGEKQNMRQGMQLGADDYITKPFTHEELVQALETQWKKLGTIQKKLKESVETVGKAVSFAIPHEFRTVLNEIIGSAKFITQSFDELEKNDVVEIANDIVKTSQRLLKITENFIIYTKLEAFANIPEKRSQLRMHHTDEPYAMLQDIATMKAQNFNRVDDLVFSDFNENISVEISTDSFYKIIDELIDNALKFSKAGTPIHISAYLSENNLAYFTIADKGRGMEPEKINSINTLTQFERDLYEQQGVGMGLIIAKRLVELHDGTFEIKSRIGEGTTVKFSLHYLQK